MQYLGPMFIRNLYFFQLEALLVMMEYRINVKLALTAV